MGRASSKAQSLAHAITSTGKLISNAYKIYIKCDGNKCIGILKVGTKKLFVQNRIGNIVEITPLCVLDFYVNEAV